MIQVLNNADLFGGKAAIHNAFGPRLNPSDSFTISICWTLCSDTGFSWIGVIWSKCVSTGLNKSSSKCRVKKARPYLTNEQTESMLDSNRAGLRVGCVIVFLQAILQKQQVLTRINFPPRKLFDVASQGAAGNILTVCHGLVITMSCHDSVNV